jgi:hypothetical protein
MSAGFGDVMFRSVFSTVLLGCWVFSGGWICACTSDKQPAIAIVPDPPSSGPVLAKVGEREVLLDDVPAMAELARQLRSQQGLPAGLPDEEENQVELAVELQALAVAAEEMLDTGKPSIQEEQERLLARVYLRRFVSGLERHPIKEEELENAYYEEIRNHMTLGKSDIYEATRVVASIIMVAYFPDQHVPEPGEKPLIEREDALEIAGKIYKACLNARKDLDDFMSVGREFSSGHPTVIFKEFWRVVKNPELSILDPVVHRAIFEMKNNGEISKPIETTRGFMVIRRGATHLGKGEQFDDVRELLEEKVGMDRRKTAFESHLSGLISRYQVRTWDEVLTEKYQQRSPVK